jgi:Ca-activated chloride channel family protein
MALGQNQDVAELHDSFKGSTKPGLRVDVDLVLLNASVTDHSNRHISGLQQQQFQVWEDKIEQQIQYFSTEDVPLSVGIIFDVSGSMQNKLIPALTAANTFMRMGDRGDEYFLVLFSDSAHLVQDFTTDVSRLQDRLLFSRAKGSTALYDALYLGLEKVTHGSNSKKALLLITDGEDNHSRYSYSDVREFAKEHDVLIYAIGIVEPEGSQVSGYGGRALLENLANLTGGMAFFPDSVNALESICAQVGVDLKNQYVLGYRSTNQTGDGKWRKVTVKINRPKGMARLAVRAKSGYYAPKIARVMN